MKPLSDRKAIIALRDAQLEAGHALTTRKQYRAWIVRYRAARKARLCVDLQGFLTRLSTVELVNPKTVRQALNALKFYHAHVETTEIYTHATGACGVVPPMDRCLSVIPFPNMQHRSEERRLAHGG